MSNYLQICTLPKVRTTLAAAVAMAVSMQASAQLEEVVVTAQKREQSLLAVAIDITAYSGDQLAAYGIDDVFGIAKAVPGITIQNTGDQSQIFMRGVGTRINGAGLDSGVATYIDDRFVSRQQSQVFDLFDVERVEVLKGPQGVLFGRNATGGAVRIITNGVSDELEGKISVGAGNYNYREARGFINVPVSDSFGLRISGQTRRRDGTKENIVPGALDFNDLDAQSLRVKARWDVTDTSTLKASYTKMRSDDLANAGAVSLDQGNNRGVALGGITTTNRDKIASALGTDPLYDTTKTDSDDVQLRFDTSLTDSVDLAAYVNYLDYTGGKPGDYDGTSTPDVEVQRVIFEAQDLGAGLELTSTSDGPLTWVVGANYFDGDNDFDFDLRVGPAGLGTVPLSVGYAKYENVAYGVFGSADYAFNDTWTLTVGGRYTYEKKENELLRSEIAVATVSPVPASDSGSWNEFTPKLTLTYNMENGIAYATYASGFKSGGFNHPLIEGAVIEPETLDMIELGYKVEMTESLRLTSTFFIYDYKDLQVTKAADSGGTVSTENATDSDIMGVDVDLEWAVTDGLTLRFGAEYLDTEYADYETAGRVAQTVLQGDPNAVGYGLVFFNAKGQDMLRAPELSFFGVVQYDRPLDIGSAGGDLSLNLNYAWKDDYLFDFQLDPTTDVVQEAHGILNGRATLTIDQFAVSIWGKNLTDEEYFNDKVVAATNNRGNYATQRTYGIDVSYSF